MKRLFAWFLSGYLIAPVSYGAADTTQVSCQDVFSTPEFQSLDLVKEDDTSRLTVLLSQLLGTGCTLDQLQTFLVSKGAILDRRTDKRLYLLVTGQTKFLITGTLRFGTSVIARIEDGKIKFIAASVAK